jgi:hypothetical protein
MKREPGVDEDGKNIDSSTYGRLQGGKDVDQDLNLRKEYAEERLGKFN